jgi:hypothetical protein
MADGGIESHRPAYALDDIRKAAENRRIRYDGRKVNSNIRDLGYTLDDVARCIVGLKHEDFRKSLTYSNVVYDVYIGQCHCPKNLNTDDIYMKLRVLGTGELSVGIGSFHL